MSYSFKGSEIQNQPQHAELKMPPGWSPSGNCRGDCVFLPPLSIPQTRKDVSSVSHTASVFSIRGFVWVPESRMHNKVCPLYIKPTDQHPQLYLNLCLVWQFWGLAIDTPKHQFAGWGKQGCFPSLEHERIEASICQDVGPI